MTPLSFLQTARFRVVAVCLGLIAAQTVNQLVLWGRAAADRETEQQAADMQRRLADVPQLLRLQTTYKGLDWSMAVNALGGDRHWNAKAQQAVTDADRRLKQQLSSLHGIDPKVVATIREEMNRASRHAIGAVDMMTRRDIASAELSAEIYRDSLQKADQMLNDILVKEQGSLEEFQQRMLNRSAFSLGLYTMMTVFSFALGVALVALVFRSFVNPLGQAVTAIRQINSGARTVDLPEQTADEFGEMAGVLRQFVQQTERLRALAYTDELTGLGSRGKLMAELTEAQAEWSRGSAALIYLDLDRFRTLNESLGHNTGDRFLVQIAGRLRAVLPPEALICRISGDEFVVLLRGLKDDAALATRLRENAERLLLAVAAPYNIDDHSVTLSASIGIAVGPRDGVTAEELMASGSAAVRLAKQQGRNNAQFASSKLTEEARRQISLLSDIRRGLDSSEFEPFYQPIVNVNTGRTVGAEALVRWRHPERGLVYPGDFIRTAEDSGLIGSLGNACLTKACAYSRDLKQRGRSLPVCVNLSARQLDDSKIVSEIDGLTSSHGLEAGDISFEITESAVMQHPDRNLRILSDIRSLGHRLSVDDFGTGYSSLSYLERFPVDRIKVDRSFVLKIESSKATRAIVSATVTLADNLGMDVVAEGVDAPEQMRRLADLGCHLQQGFLYAKALPPNELEAWLERPQATLRSMSRTRAA